MKKVCQGRIRVTVETESAKDVFLLGQEVTREWKETVGPFHRTVQIRFEGQLVDRKVVKR